MIKMKTFFIICDMKENRLDYLQQGASSQEYILDFNLLFFCRCLQKCPYEK